MPLVNTGQITLSDIAGEFGGTTPHQLSEYYDTGNAPSSGEIQLAADFYGTSASYTVDYLVIAGGGGGGGGEGTSGGGGAGGLRTGTLTLSPGVVYTVL